jgi:hypothetical protein
MSKPSKKWRYLKRPSEEVIEMANGWRFIANGDVIITGPSFWSEEHKNLQAPIQHIPQGEGPVTLWIEERFGITLMCDHVQDARTGRWMLHCQIGMRKLEREPTWEEYKAVREAIFPPDVDTAIILPSLDQYVNVAEWAFHIWQLPEPWALGDGWADAQRFPPRSRYKPTAMPS